MQCGIGKIEGQVTDKPEPRQSGQTTYHTIVIADIGWSARFNCSPEVYHKCTAGDGKRLQFEGNLSPIRATRAGGKFPDDMMTLFLDVVIDPSAPPAKPAAPAK